MAAGLVWFCRAIVFMRPGNFQTSARLRVLLLVGGSLILGIFFTLPSRCQSPAESTESSVTTQTSLKPLTLDELVNLIKQHKKDTQAVLSSVRERSVDFDLDEKTEKKLRKAGADDQLLPEIWKATPKGKASLASLLTTPTGNDIEAPAAQALALQDIQAAGDPRSALELAGDFEKKYPDSSLLSYVYTSEARAHQDQGSLDQAIESARKSLKLDSDNTFSLIILAVALTQPKALKGSSQEVAARLQEADSDATRALTLLDKLKSRPGETDDQFQQRKGALAADAHFALGSVSMQREDYDRALTQYQLAIASTSKPTFQYYYRLAEAYASIGETSKAIDALRKASDLARGTPMQKYVDDFMAELRSR
jgi:tetratricopeptide (TPR) repeat protein